MIDREATLAVAKRIEQAIPALVRPAHDATSRYVAQLLSCPRMALGAADRTENGTESTSLDSRCNLK
jgi:hypothetical protein